MPEYNDFIMRLVNMKDEAARLGLFATMQALDHATKAVGWEVADKMQPRKGSATPVKARPDKMRERQLAGCRR